MNISEHTTFFEQEMEIVIYRHSLEWVKSGK